MPMLHSARNTTRPARWVAATALLALAGCGMGMHRHGEMHDRMHGGPASAGGPVTAPAKTGESLPALPGGYAKVAAPAGVALYFVNLRNGDVVTSPVRIVFGLRGMGVAPAGVAKEGTGHHHLLVDVGEFDINAPLPATDQHRHFGAGQTEATLELKPGTHTLQLVLGDQNHIPHHPPVMSERVTITVR